MGLENFTNKVERALINHYGEEVQVKTPLGIDTYKIVSWKER